VLGGGAGAAANSPEQQVLWILSAGSTLPFLQQQQQHSGFSDTAGFAAAGTDGVLSQAAASHAASMPARQSSNSAGLHGLMQIGSSNLTAAVAAASALLQPSCSAQLQQQQQPLPQQQQWPTSSAAVGLLPLPGMLPPLPSLPDSALQLAQQLMLQELAGLSQQLNQTAALARPVIACLGGPCSGAAAAASTVMPVSAEHVSATPSLQDWQSSPTAAAAAAAPAAIHEQQQGSSTGALCGRAAADAFHLSGMHAALPAAAGAAPDSLYGVTAPAVGGGLLLAPGELQQISVLHQELALLQQQLNSACGTGLASMPANGLMAHQYMPALGENMQAMQQQLVQQMQAQQMQMLHQSVAQCQDSSNTPGQAPDTNRLCSAVPAAAQPAAAEADVSDAAIARPGDGSQEVLPSAAASSSAVSSAASVSGSSQQQTGGQGHSRVQGFGNLFRRRSGRKQQQ
jgi:hypothetical protein